MLTPQYNARRTTYNPYINITGIYFSVKDDFIGKVKPNDFNAWEGLCRLGHIYTFGELKQLKDVKQIDFFANKQIMKSQSLNFLIKEVSAKTPHSVIL